MAKKYYAVRKGLVPGIYTSWSECQQNINGFSGAEHKWFRTQKEAQAYLDGENETTSGDDRNISRIFSDAEAVAYVGGSYNNTTGEYGYGLVMFHNGGEEHFAGKFTDSDMASMKNVAGEIEGAKATMKFCIDNGIKSLDLFYDYQGIKDWCTGAYRANKPGTIEYRKYYNSIIKCKPGVTGMWQANGRSDVEFNYRCKLDDYYYHNWSIWLDFTIIYKTIKGVVYGKGSL